MKYKTLKGYAVMNIELGVPCVEIDDIGNDMETSSAVYVGRDMKACKWLCYEYLRRNGFDTKARRKLHLKVVEITLRYPDIK